VVPLRTRRGRHLASYQRVADDLDELIRAVGLKAARSCRQREQNPRQRLYNGLSAVKLLLDLLKQGPSGVA
jgi:hypothetical protein